jgi:hypothetical protein
MLLFRISLWFAVRFIVFSNTLTVFAASKLSRLPTLMSLNRPLSREYSSLLGRLSKVQHLYISCTLHLGLYFGRTLRHTAKTKIAEQSSLLERLIPM